MSVLYLTEYENTNAYGDFLHYYDKLDGYLHEMPPEEIVQHINRNGKTSSILQRLVIRNYFSWLVKNHKDDIGEEFINNNYEFEKLLREDESQYIGFYTLQELKQTIEQHTRQIEVLNDSSPYATDYYGLKAMWYLELYGVTNEAAISIKLDDVSNDGATICVPVEKREIKIDDINVAEYLAEYKARTGFKKSENSLEEKPYTQDTFYRTISGIPITMKTIYNIKDRFRNLCPDERFDKKRLYYAGRYYQMFLKEENLGQEYSMSNSDHRQIIEQIFNQKFNIQTLNRMIQDYKLYKKGYLENLK